MERQYPYLGLGSIDNKNYVVLFLKEDEGVVVMNETDSEEIRFGMYGNFAEEAFEFLSPDQCVRLSN